MSKVLKSGSSGYFVTQWQYFLRGQGYPIAATGAFDAETRAATMQFQRKHKLDVDGIVGNQTLGRAAMLGFEIVEYGETESNYPAKPKFAPLLGNAARQAAFGPLEFLPAPTPKNPEAIRITNGWDRDNVVAVEIPQLRGVKGANKKGVVHFHKKAAKQLAALWRDWEKSKLLKHILTYEGDYVPRFVRGRAQDQILSNHAFATAFDINYAWNRLGAEPATAGTTGCVYELVPIAHKHGFYWGGHFTRKDGMHFEVAKLIR